GRRSRSGRHAGVAALGHQRDAMLGGKLDDLGHLLRRGGREYGAALAVDAPAPVARPRLDLLGVGDHAPRAEHPYRLLDELRLSTVQIVVILLWITGKTVISGICGNRA